MTTGPFAARRSTYRSDRCRTRCLADRRRIRSASSNHSRPLCSIARIDTESLIDVQDTASTKRRPDSPLHSNLSQHTGIPPSSPAGCTCRRSNERTCRDRSEGQPTGVRPDGSSGISPVVGLVGAATIAGRRSVVAVSALLSVGIVEVLLHLLLLVVHGLRLGTFHIHADVTDGVSL